MKLNQKKEVKYCLISNFIGLGLNITFGIVTSNNTLGIGFNNIKDFIQIDVAANSVLSGGAVVIHKGEFV